MAYESPADERLELGHLGLVVLAVEHGGPRGLAELVLPVAHELGERRVELAELALEVEHRHRPRVVVEAGLRAGAPAAPPGLGHAWRASGTGDGPAARAPGGAARGVVSIFCQTSVNFSCVASLTTPARSAALRAMSASRRAATAAWRASSKPDLYFSVAETAA